MHFEIANTRSLHISLRDLELVKVQA
jgi:hypothetical protein